MSNRRKVVPGIFIPAFIALMGFGALVNAISGPRFQNFRTVDVVQLIAAGMCFGAAIAAAVMVVRGDR
jgi:hypothetical protein